MLTLFSHQLTSCFLLLIALSSFCQSEETRLNSVILAVEDSWPPYADTNGMGISTSIIEQAYASVGIKLITKVSPYARVLSEIEKGIVVGGYNVTRQQSTEDNFIFGKHAILSATASFYFSTSNIKASQFASINEIPNGSKIGLIIDYEYGDIYEQHKHRFEEIRVSKQEQIINMLRLGRLDSAIMFDAVAQYTLNKMELNANESIQKGPLNHTSAIYVAFSKQHKNASYFASKLDQGLITIKQNGQYEQLIDSQ
jgi:polar amino acid transport system substrate-binding protein